MMNSISWIINNETLNRIRDNDPNLRKLCLIRPIVADNTDLSLINGFTENSHLAIVEVDFSGLSFSYVERFPDLFNEIAKIKSLQEAEFCGCLLEGCILQLVNVQSLVKLTFRGCTINKDGFKEIESLLTNPGTKLKYLCVEGFDDQFFVHLFDGLARCKTLKSLSILFGDEITAKGWQVLASVLMESSTSLRELRLLRCGICEEGALALANGISLNKTLEKLDAHDLRSITETGMIAISAVLGANSSLKTLHLDENDEVSDSVIFSLADALSVNGTVEDLSISFCLGVTTSGWIALSRIFQNHRLVLNKLDISLNAINDEVIASFALSLRGNTSLKYIDISGSGSPITNVGWEALSGLLSEPNTCLETMCIGENDMDDEALEILIHGMGDNNKLQTLELTDNLITSHGWEMLTNMLCNTSSIEATRYSNHTLCNLDVEIPPGLSSLLRMNKHHNKNNVARRKVIDNHFSGPLDLNALVGDQQKLLPYTASWFGRDSLGFQALYQIIRSIPGVCNNLE